MTKFEHEGNIMSLEHCLLLLSILGLQTLLHTHRQAQKLAHCICLGLFSHFRAEKVAGTPAVEPPKHWHGITWTIKKGLKETVQERYFILGVFQMTVL